jgi:hypothetical protein
MQNDLLQKVNLVVKESNGILSLAPTWVARDFMPGGHRLGLSDYSVEDKRRGEICERWIGSTTQADNAYGPKDEGLSYIACPDGSLLLLRDAINIAGGIILGEEYSRTHRGLNVFTDFFDYAAALPFHLHTQVEKMGQISKRLKDEAYYFPEDVPTGNFPYTFLGVHPSLALPENRTKLIPYIEKWETDEILKFSKAYNLMPGEGFFVPSGTLHAPGTVLTLEIQEGSDVMAMFQGTAGGKPISRDLLWKDLDPELRRRNDLLGVLDVVNWEVCGDPYFYENHHTSETLVDGSRQPGGEEFWIFYGSNKFSGKKCVVGPGRSLDCRERGAFAVLVWRGEGTFSDRRIKAGPERTQTNDELFVCYDAATRPHKIRNTGSSDLILFKMFGPEVNPDAPALPHYT